MRLIDADALMPNAEYKGRYDVVTAYDIANAPTIEPKRKGKWITDNPNNPYESNYCKCSVCGYTNCTTEVLAFDGYNFCPNCWADMREQKLQNGDSDTLQDGLMSAT